MEFGFYGMKSEDYLGKTSPEGGGWKSLLQQSLVRMTQQTQGAANVYFQAVSGDADRDQ